MIFEKKLIAAGGSLAVTIPIDLCRYLELGEGDEITIEDKSGPKGKFMVIYKKKTETE